MSSRRFGSPLLLLLTIVAAVLWSSADIRAQLPPPLAPPPTPNFNPSSPLVVPQAPEAPVSPRIGGGTGLSEGVGGASGDIIAVEPNHDAKSPHPHHRHHRQAPPKQ